jgi:hypothetical protein
MILGKFHELETRDKPFWRVVAYRSILGSPDLILGGLWFGTTWGNQEMIAAAIDAVPESRRL